MEKEDVTTKVSQALFLMLSVMLGILAVLSIADFFLNLSTASIDIDASHILLDKILYSIILVELVHLTLTYTLTNVINPRELILIILTAVGRKLIVKDLFLESPTSTFASAAVMLACIYALKVLPADQTRIE